MVKLLRWWRIIWPQFQDKAAFPNGIKDSQSSCLIEGIQWPDDVALVGRDNSQMLSYESTVFDNDFIFDIGDKDTNKQAASGKHHKLRVWKTESPTIEVGKTEVLRLD